MHLRATHIHKKSTVPCPASCTFGEYLIPFERSLHQHTHTHTDALKHTHTHTHTNTHAHGQAHVQAHAYKPSYTNTPPLIADTHALLKITYISTHAHTCMHMQALKTIARTRIPSVLLWGRKQALQDDLHTHTHTHTHTYASLARNQLALDDHLLVLQLLDPLLLRQVLLVLQPPHLHLLRLVAPLLQQPVVFILLHFLHLK
jgi:hypothetical protein